MPRRQLSEEEKKIRSDRLKSAREKWIQMRKDRKVEEPEFEQEIIIEKSYIQPQKEVIKPIEKIKRDNIQKINIKVEQNKEAEALQYKLKEYEDIINKYKANDIPKEIPKIVTPIVTPINTEFVNIEKRLKQKLSRY